MDWAIPRQRRYRRYCQANNLDPTQPSSAAQYMRTKKGHRTGDIESNVGALKKLGIDTYAPELQTVILECRAACPNKHIPKDLAASQRSKRMWQDPSYRDRYHKSHDKARGRMSQLKKDQWQTPAYRDKMTASLSTASTKMWQDPHFRENAIATRKRIGADPAFKAKMSAIATQQWEQRTPEQRRQVCAAVQKTGAWKRKKR